MKTRINISVFSHRKINNNDDEHGSCMQNCFVQIDIFTSSVLFPHLNRIIIICSESIFPTSYIFFFQLVIHK